jgi:hypothetical protein
MKNAIRIAASLLLAALIVLSVLGWGWSAHAPATWPEVPGRLILGACALAGALGLWKLWAPERRRAA